VKFHPQNDPYGYITTTRVQDHGYINKKKQFSHIKSLLLTLLVYLYKL